MELPPEAFGQDGRFTTEQACAFGLSGKVLARAVRDGLLDHPVRGVYAALADAVDPVAVHRTLVRDRQLAADERWYVARRSGALLMGLPLIGYPPAVPQLVRDGNQPGAHGRDRHARISPLPPADTWTYDGLDMCTPARVVVDIARRESFRSAVVVADGALRRGVDRADLEACARRMPRWPGVARARQVIRFADGRAEAPSESLMRVACLREQLPIPEPQVEVYLWGELLGRVDGMYREYLLALETDGAIKFEGKLVLPALLTRQEDIRYAGVDVLRTNWAETIKDTTLFGQRVRERLRERGRRPLPPGLELRSTVVRPQLPLLGSPHDLAA
jgi:hypothetical protein